MQVVILCGGRGTRLEKETEYRPKPMVSIGSKPILYHIMQTYSNFGFNDFIIKQTILSENKNVLIENGFGNGSFVVIKGKI